MSEDDALAVREHALAVDENPICLWCRGRLSGRQTMFCSDSHKQQHYDAKTKRQLSRFCCDCGTPIYGRSTRCKSDAVKLSNAARKAPVAGLKFAGTLNPYCPNLAIEFAECETEVPHAHCECGWPVLLGMLACHICIAEQPRLEFKSLVVFAEEVA